MAPAYEKRWMGYRLYGKKGVYGFEIGLWCWLANNLCLLWNCNIPRNNKKGFASI